MTSEFKLTWSPPTIQNTKDGVRTIRTSAPTPEFWAAWRSSKEGLKAKGYAVIKLAKDGDYQVSHWQIPSAAPATTEVPVLERPMPLSRPEGLLDYQKEPAARLLRSIRQFTGVLDASDTGIGKTYMDLAVFRELGITPTVICPKAVIPSWEKAAKHLGMGCFPINYEKVRTGNTPFGKWVTVRGTNGVERFQWSRQVAGLIFDEAHRCKSTKSQNADLLIGATLQDLPRITTSATLASSPMEMRAVGFSLGLHGLRDFWDWAAAHGCYRNQWDGWEWGGADEDIESIHRQVFPARGIRLRISELGDAFPKTQISTELIPVSAPDKIDKAYAEVRRAIAAIHEKAKTDSDKALHLTAQLRQRQVSEAQKIPALIELTKDALAERRSVFIGVNFTDSIEVIKSSLKDIPVVTLYGEMTDKDRRKSMELFQSDRARVIIANLDVGGVGVSLHDIHGRFPRTALICPSWNARTLKQALGRIHRAEGRSVSIQRILYAAGTVEERVAERVDERLRTMSIMNDGVEISITDEDLQ